ncbi:N-acetyllactosaminide 3-alpha-galactosyltransferase [Dictyocaulus viviparus]|uniref:Hexosyltransferase n=1 Tax=Dictyocaulus viviparus TaxID=29172 RepID=A0A0D8XGT6_DICVI|nr:N-acetyllactosaminide 3-alpha-galactosyltransferase [Dictyocaulus viviparus]
MFWRTLASYVLLKRHRPSPSPLKLIVLLFIWILPYLLLANYLERSLLPFRLLCYTQSDLLSSEPLRNETPECIRQYFPNRTPDPECTLTALPRILQRPQIPMQPRRILFVRTAPHSIDYRNFIRDTWKTQTESFAVVIFVCATGANITSEAMKYRGNPIPLKIQAEYLNRIIDILHFDFIDSYHNLSLKMMAIYGFVLQEIPSVKEIIITNDDTIVNATALIQLLNVERTGSWMLGKVSRGYPRLFMTWLPWHVPGEMYPNLCYPRFTQGSSFILSRDAARVLLENICQIPFVHLDDVMMGIVASCTRLKLLHHNGFDKHTLANFVVYHYQYTRHSALHLRQLWSSIF